MSKSYRYGSIGLRAVVLGVPFFLLIAILYFVVIYLMGAVPWDGPPTQAWALFAALIGLDLAWGVPLNLYLWNHRIAVDERSIREIDILGRLKRTFQFEEVEGWTHQRNGGEDPRFVIELWRGEESIGWTDKIRGYEELSAFVSTKLGADVRRPCPRSLSARARVASQSWQRK